MTTDRDELQAPPAVTRTAVPRGFTLIELLVALTIAGVMLVYAIPAFNDFTVQRRMASNANLFVSAINYARSEAARQSGTVTVQSVDAGTATDEWGEGFCVTLDDPGDCDAALSSFVPEGADITFNALTGLNGLDSLSFNGRGMLMGGVNGEIQICGADAEDDPGREIIVNAVGRTSVRELTCFP